MGHSVRPQRGGYAVSMWRAPVRFYDHGLGWLLGRRFLCLTHQGRTSGKRYRTVLEVLAIEGDEVMVIAGTGPSADWFRNLAAGSPGSVQIGRIVFAADHRALGAEEAAGVVADYERRPRSCARFSRRWWAGPTTGARLPATGWFASFRRWLFALLRRQTPSRSEVFRARAVGRLGRC